MIEIDKLNDGYYNFPYQSGEGDSTSDTSSPCVGGFNLIQHPELIEEIPEAKYSPMLKKLLIDLNKEDSPYLTLGCGYWAFKDNRDTSYTYLEFSFKNIKTAQNLSFIQTIDEQFIDYLHTHREQLGSEFGVPPEAFDTAHLAFAWNYRPFSYFGSEERTLLYFQAGSPQHQDLEIFLDLLHRFLTEYLQVPS